jgi:hypothetical protein
MLVHTPEVIHHETARILHTPAYITRRPGVHHHNHTLTDAAESMASIQTLRTGRVLR